jgi:hypothetical protein
MLNRKIFPVADQKNLPVKTTGRQIHLNKYTFSYNNVFCMIVGMSRRTGCAAGAFHLQINNDVRFD